MVLLLDTHILLWLSKGDPRLTLSSRSLIETAERVFVSAASIWEIAIKVRAGKLIADPDQLLREIHDNDFEELPVYGRHAREVARLPLLHGDPFDRLLIAQAIADHLQLMSADAQVKAYSAYVSVI